jgi:hypothetical protein
VHHDQNGGMVLVSVSEREERRGLQAHLSEEVVRVDELDQRPCAVDAVGELCSKVDDKRHIR